MEKKCGAHDRFTMLRELMLELIGGMNCEAFAKALLVVL